ncbi:efflux transporter outer membrane subunit [Acidicapsa acidisoli]|uniref:efflux transporter outer membrane subunit n=1 Tax=Acidicapsa acidisoli TaxID=1615681 RepID=UPI0021E004D1|nr:efflux transporter outer membrane subunit [Acidicapsa acidisoli]
MRNRFQNKFGTGSAWFLLLSASMLSGCAVGPNYHRPAVQTPPAFHGHDQSQQTEPQTASFADLPWWQVFHDPQLLDLIRAALKQNYDLQLAVERVNAARAQVGITRSNEFPQVSLDPTFSGGKTDQNIKSNVFSLSGDALFQVDLFGRYRRATEAARAQLLGTQDAQQTVILTLVSDVASDYFLLRNLDLQLQITRETVRTQEDSVKLTKLRLEHGVATTLDVLQARQVLDVANAQIPDLERQIGQTEDALNILLGKYPDNVPRGMPLGIETPEGWTWSESLPPQLPTGLPSQLLERRPDIHQAEENLVAANANIGVAKAMFFPQLSLLGSGGAAFGHSQFAGSHIPAPLGAGTYSASLTQPVFEGGYLRNNLRYAKSEERQALIGYQQTIQRAFGDVSDALIGYDKYHVVRERQEQSVKDLQESVNVSLMRYRGGTSNYLDVLDSQRSLFNAELTLAQARNNEYQGLVQLYKALGGGWK